MLASWNDGAAKSAIVDFVARMTKEGGAEYVPPSGRIATSDNDGTLWCEQPLQAQFFFGHDRLKAMVAKGPSVKARQPFKAFLDHDAKTIHELGKRGFFEVAAAVHAGMTEEEFDHHARAWLAASRHPTLGRPFTQLTYQPQKELPAYLRQNGFKAFVVSGGGIDVIRAFRREECGIPREQVVGSSVKTRFETTNGAGDLKKLAEVNSFDDREAKPVSINLHIGRRPISRSATPTATSRCCVTRRPAPAPASCCACTGTTPSANSPVTASSS